MCILCSSHPTQILPCDVYSFFIFSGKWRRTVENCPSAMSLNLQDAGLTVNDSNGNGLKREDVKADLGCVRFHRGCEM